MAPVLSSAMPSLVIDTNVLVGALLGGSSGSARRVIAECLRGSYQPVVGAALYREYEEVFGRQDLWRDSTLTPAQRETVLDGFLSVSRWVEVFFAWRPNLPDEADNHLVELALAGGAVAIVTRNVRDLAGGELKFPNLRVLTPPQCLEIFPCPP